MPGKVGNYKVVSFFPQVFSYMILSLQGLIETHLHNFLGYVQLLTATDSEWIETVKNSPCHQ